ncbi:MAG TPA: hypothetical protein VKC63_03050 [Solirubrobacterales bacterium]|nr:hypothetical protein [Solirubrobacterales bacterium]
MRERIERAERQVERYDGQRERAQELRRRFRKDELARIDRDEARSQERLAGLEAEARGLPVPSGSSRRELAVADRVLAERRELAITAARISPPAYIASELGKRPSDPTKRKAWDRGVEAIETYRQRHGIKDPHKALGRERDRERQRETLRRVHEAQRALGLGPHAAREGAQGRSLGIGR